MIKMLILTFCVMSWVGQAEAAEAQIGVSAKIVNQTQRATAKAEVYGADGYADYTRCLYETDRPDYCLPLIEPATGDAEPVTYFDAGTNTGYVDETINLE